MYTCIHDIFSMHAMAEIIYIYSLDVASLVNEWYIGAHNLYWV